MLRALFLGLMMGSLPYAVASAEDYVETEGLLSDEDFYRLVACAAPPGTACRKTLVRWPVDRPLRVQLTQVDPAFLGGKQNRARAALVRAIKFINRADTAITLRQVDTDAKADIRIYLIDTDGDAPIQGTGIEGIDGATVTGARVIVWSRSGSGEIQRAKIIFGTRLHIRHYESAMIEELTQALGLLTDIRNPDYLGRSIFSQDDNDSKDLGPQDLMALRRHYPPQE
ncbi:hypothetical protein ANTHELSMS3_04400 [Antarctobacter heliothermus]|uniref:Uncharacterized protein n=1 Tax=Antarctobacter heliothermus TaxID=74033 RepID=A0A222EAL5_9RHOB|nr:DUF2927 domain-containing protein [Antarctobacter heliothermus]ASP23001.1 hypothetical protein ANTHELSMS3_04400 [Antarctobacter heliothermus]